MAKLKEESQAIFPTRDKGNQTPDKNNETPHKGRLTRGKWANTQQEPATATANYVSVETDMPETEPRPQWGWRKPQDSKR